MATQAGFLDVGQIEKTKENFRLLCNTKGRRTMDPKGPGIRTGSFKEGLAGGKIHVKQGKEPKLVTDFDFKGDT